MSPALLFRLINYPGGGEAFWKHSRKTTLMDGMVFTCNHTANNDELHEGIPSLG